MLRRALPLLAAFLLVAGAALAATDPGRRSPDLATVAAVNDVAVNDAGTRLSAATNDAGSTQLNQNPDQDVWYLWDEDGAVVQHGAADRANCSQFAGDQCQSPATAIAMSDDGSRLAIASRITRPAAASTQETLLVFATASAGEVARLSLAGQPRALAMSSSGALAAILTENQPNTLSMDTEAKLFVFNWGAGNAVAQAYEATMPDPGSEMALSRDGQRILVATNPGSGTGKVNWFTGSSSTVTEATVTGARPAALAVAGAPPHRALAGYQTGDLALFADGSKTTPLHKLQYGGGSTAVTDVAIARSGLQAVAGYSDGTVRLFSIDASLEKLTRLGSDPKPSASAINHVAYSGDGNYVAVASGTLLVMYSASPTGLAKLWETTLASAATAIALDNTGDHLAVGSGSAVAVFQAKRAVAGTFVGALPVTANPGTRVAGQVKLENVGNRPESLSVSLSFPDGWFAEVSPTSVQLAPGESKLLDLTVIVPEGAAPMTHRLWLNTSAGSTPIDVKVPLVRDLVLDLPEGPGVDVGSGETVNRRLVVANRGNQPETVRPTVQASDGWTASVSPSELVVAPGADGEFQLSLKSPAGAGSGDSGSATVTLPGFAGAQVKLTGTVGASFGAEVTGPAGFEVRPGQNRTLTFTLRNAGNTPDSFDVKLAATAPSGWKVAFAEGGRVAEERDVAPGETRTVAVSVEAPDDAGDGDSFNVELSATSQSNTAKTGARTTLVSASQDAGSDSQSSTGGKKGGKGLPGLEAPLLGVALVALAVALRRRNE